METNNWINQLDKLAWFQVGNGRRIHAFTSGPYAICGIGGALSGPFNPDYHQKCKACCAVLRQTVPTSGDMEA